MHNDYFSSSPISDFVYRQGLSKANCQRSESREHQQISRNSLGCHTTPGKQAPLSFSLYLPPSIDSSLSLSHSSSLPASFLSSHVSAKLPRLLSVHMLGSSPRYHRGIHPQTKSLHQVFWMASVTESC